MAKLGINSPRAHKWPTPNTNCAALNLACALSAAFDRSKRSADAAFAENEGMRPIGEIRNQNQTPYAVPQAFSNVNGPEIEKRSVDIGQKFTGG